MNRKGTARRVYQSGPGFRNHAATHSETERELIIDPGPRTVCTPGDRALFNTGRFRSKIVPLGEIAMEKTGSLRLLGGFGRSGSDPPQPRLNSTNGHRADNSHWFDDVSDGPVSAKIELSDGTVVTSSAWAVIAPPDFAPGIKNIVTLYDVIHDLAIQRGLLPAPTASANGPSFTQHVQPILARALGYRWVNRFRLDGLLEDKAHNIIAQGNVDFARFWAELANPSLASSELRTSFVCRLRDPGIVDLPDEANPFALVPRLRNIRRGRTGADDVLPLTVTQYKIMLAWAEGNFINDLGHSAPAKELLPDAITRMALESCVGGALDPGIEVSRAVLFDRDRYLPDEPFRLSHVAVQPGEVTQYNAVPWQADFLACAWEELDGPWPRWLGWWPAQRPDDVYPHLGAMEMVPWARGLGNEYQDMIDRWDRLGIVVDAESHGDPFFVERERDIGTLGP